MFSRRTTLQAGLAVLIAATALPALAQTPVVRVRGTIAALDGATLIVITREGPTVKITLPDTLEPVALKRVALDAVKPNSFIGAVATPAADGTLQASYVLIFPEAMRGTGEGHYDWDLAPGTTMTNATVTSFVQANAGHKLSLVYKGTPIDLAVPADAPILTFTTASRADLKPGAKVLVNANKVSDGVYNGLRVTVGKDGVNPPQ